MEELQSVIWQALGSILVVLSGIAVRELKRWAESREITEKLKGKEYLIRWVVEGIEQVYENEEGPEKLRIAKEKAIFVLNDAGLNFTMDELDALIEAMVFEMNKELKGPNREDELPVRVKMNSKDIKSVHLKDEDKKEGQ